METWTRARKASVNPTIGSSVSAGLQKYFEKFTYIPSGFIWKKLNQSGLCAFVVIIIPNLTSLMKYDQSNTGINVVANLTSRVLNYPHDPPQPSSPQRSSIKPVFGLVALLFAYSPFQPLSNVIWAPSVHMMSAAAWLTPSPLQTKGSRFSSPRLSIVSLRRLPL